MRAPIYALLALMAAACHSERHTVREESAAAEVRSVRAFRIDSLGIVAMVELDSPVLTLGRDTMAVTSRHARVLVATERHSVAAAQAADSTVVQSAAVSTDSLTKTSPPAWPRVATVLALLAAAIFWWWRKQQ